jgi:hypothetical protein
VRFEVFTLVIMENGVFWDVTPIFIGTAVKTSNLTQLPNVFVYLLFIQCCHIHITLSREIVCRDYECIVLSEPVD